MTPATENTDDLKSNSPDRPRSRRQRYWLVAVAVVLALLAAISAQMWMALNMNLPQASGQSLAETTRDLERRIGDLERRIDALAEREPAVVPVASNELWWLDEAHRYLAEAAQRLEHGDDIGAALPALRSARRTLAGVDLPAAVAVKQILDKEIRLLDEYKNEDAAQAMTGIDRLLAQLYPDEATPLRGKTDQERTSAAAAESKGVWTRLGQAALEQIKQAVVIETKDRADRLSVTHGVVMRSLVVARGAVLDGDNMSYRHALANAMHVLEQSRHTDAPLYTELQALYALDIAGMPPRIGKALDQIRSLSGEMAR